MGRVAEGALKYPSLVGVSPSPLTTTTGEISSFFRDRYGENIHVEKSSKLSVLRDLRALVGRALGSCPFADEPSASGLIDDVLFESDPSAGVKDPPQLPNEEEARYCIRWYTAAGSCVFDLFSHDALIEDIIPCLSAPPSNDSRSCMNYIILAIGALCGPRDMDAQATSFFTYGRYLAVTHFFESPGIATVGIYSLLTMYLLSSSRWSAASMHIGVAVRTAYVLGINRSDISARFSATEESTGFDAITGDLMQIDIRGSTSETLAQKWKDCAKTHLGMSVADFPNLFFTYGPQAPTALCNGPTSAEYQGEFIIKVINDMKMEGLRSIQAEREAEKKWREDVRTSANASLLPDTNSWYMGTNIPGKPR